MNRSKSIRLILLLLSLCMLLSACTEPLATPSDTPTAEQTQPQTTESATTEPTVPSLLKIYEKKQESYVIVYGKEDSVGKIVAYELQRRLRLGSYAPLNINSDSTAPVAKEILVGNTNRAESKTNDKTQGYTVAAKGEKVVLNASNEDLLQAAVECFLNALTYSEGLITLPSSTDIEVAANVRVKLKIASYNIKNGDLTDHDFQVLANDILATGAEIVGLQEVDQNTSRNGYQDTLKLLSQYTGMKYYAFLPTISPYKKGEYGIAILSKYPILDVERIYLPQENASDERRGLLRAVVDVNGVQVNFLSTHCHWNGFEEQLTTIAQSVASLENFVVVGDYNSEDFDLHSRVFPNAHFAVGKENPMSTTPGGGSIDNMIASPNFFIRNCRPYLEGHSDHYLIYADLILINES